MNTNPTTPARRVSKILHDFINLDFNDAAAVDLFRYNMSIERHFYPRLRPTQNDARSLNEVTAQNQTLLLEYLRAYLHQEPLNVEHQKQIEQVLSQGWYGYEFAESLGRYIPVITAGTYMSYFVHCLNLELSFDKYYEFSTCSVCQREFVKHRRDQVHCSMSCQNKKKSRKYRARKESETGGEDYKKKRAAYMREYRARVKREAELKRTPVKE
jgi:hypothetical protein